VDIANTCSLPHILDTTSNKIIGEIYAD